MEEFELVDSVPPGKGASKWLRAYEMLMESGAPAVKTVFKTPYEAEKAAGSARYFVTRYKLDAKVKLRDLEVYLVNPHWTADSPK